MFSYLKVLEDGHPTEMLQQAIDLRTRSASYYASLAQKDSWVAVKDKVKPVDQTTLQSIPCI
jgi:hypothetical protein